MIVSLLVKRVHELPTLCLETFRRLLAQHFVELRHSNKDLIDLQLSIMSLGAHLKQHRHLFAPEHQQVLEQLFEFMMRSCQQSTSHLVKRKAHLL